MNTERWHLANQESHIGDPILFSSGQFMGRKLRFELRELQKAESGRKKVWFINSKYSYLILAHRYAKVDRRPLDPPPAVHLRIFEVLNTREQEIIYE